MTLSLDTFLPFRLNRLADCVHNDFSQIYRDAFGLTRPEWRTLVILGSWGSATATQISLQSHLHKAKVSRAVVGLEQRGWLGRSPDPTDRRVEWLALTEAGRAAYDAVSAPALVREAEVLGRLSEDQREALDQALRALEAVVGALPQKR